MRIQDENVQSVLGIDVPNTMRDSRESEDQARFGSRDYRSDHVNQTHPHHSEFHEGAERGEV